MLQTNNQKKLQFGWCLTLTIYFRTITKFVLDYVVCTAKTETGKPENNLNKKLKEREQFELNKNKIKLKVKVKIEFTHHNNTQKL